MTKEICPKNSEENLLTDSDDCVTILRVISRKSDKEIPTAVGGTSDSARKEISPKSEPNCSHYSYEETEGGWANLCISTTGSVIGVCKWLREQGKCLEERV